MPKNVGLAISLKNCLRSKEFISYLNSLGHCISYDDVLRIETRWAEDILASEDGYATVPSNIVPGVFTQAAADNGDYGQENSSQHVTNIVLYQSAIPEGTFSRVSTTRKPTFRRSITLPPATVEEVRYFDNIRLPEDFSNINLSEWFDEKESQSRQSSKRLTTVWMLLRTMSIKHFVLAPTQTVPEWTGFRKLFTLQVNTPSVIGNCRSIPAPPNDISVVHSMLLNVMKILTNIGQRDPCITVDESVYELAKKVQWSTPSLQDLTLRLGGFHRAKNFLGVIGKRMRSTGFEEILEASGLFGSKHVEGRY